MSLQKGYKGAVALEMNLERAFLYVGTQVVESWRRGGEMQIDGMWSSRITSGKWWQEEIKSERGREGGSGRERESTEEASEGNSEVCIVKYHITALTFKLILYKYM